MVLLIRYRQAARPPVVPWRDEKPDDMGMFDEAMSTILLIALGFFTGIKHSLDTDHVAAVSSLVTRTRKLSSAVWAGAWWGLGHTVTLMIAGVALVAFEVTIPDRLALSLELLVGLMLVAVGAVNVRIGWLERFHFHRHEHDAHLHIHVHAHDSGQQPHDHAHAHERSRAKAFLVGTVHGMAGSAALTLLVLTTVKSVFLGIVYILVFGLGSVLGMAVFSLILGLPVAAVGRRFTGLSRVVTMATGSFSLIIGLLLVHRIGSQLL